VGNLDLVVIRLMYVLPSIQRPNICMVSYTNSDYVNEILTSVIMKR
jgi:hypothetical protein